MKKGFTLTELLVVIAIIGLLMGILLPSLSRARGQAKIVAVNAELRQIGICLDMYMNDNSRKPPPTRKDCTLGWEDHQLPPELVAFGYLPRPASGSGMSAGIEDRFHCSNTYKYWAVGELYQNGKFTAQKKASLYIPTGFSCQEGSPETDIQCDDLAKSPVTWVIYSQGPKYDDFETLKELHGPVPQRTWYSPQKRKGIIVRMELKKGNHIGSFE
ncbi:MAG: type II secretion system protein [Phycisphaerae bacterium]|jgi:prepilin-type N-terminal cleavage/methylation domain-containing protein